MFNRKVQGMLGRSGPFPVAEDMQYVQGLIRSQRTLKCAVSGFMIVVCQAVSMLSVYSFGFSIAGRWPGVNLKKR